MELTSSSNLHVLSVSSPTTECATVVGPISAGHARHVGSGRRTRVPLTVPTESSPLVITAPPTTPILSPSSGMVGSKSCSHLSYSSSGSSCWVGSQPSALSSSVNDLTIVPTQHGGDLTSGDSATNSSSPGQGIRKSLPRPASAPLIKDVGEPLGSGAQAVVCRATLSSFKERVALVMGKQPIPDATMQVLYLLAARRPKHVVAVLHPDVTAAVAPNKCSDRSVDCDKSSAHVFPSECNFDGSGHHGEERECSVAIQECTCSLTDILTKKRYACTKKGFADAVRHLVSHAEAEDERPGLHDCDEGVGKVTQAQTAPSFMFSEATDMPSAPSTVEGVFPAGEQMTPLTNAMSSECCSNIAADDCLADILSPSNNSCAPPHGLDLQNDRLVSEAFLAGLARHILIGLGGLHDLHLAHNDLKMSNILFDEATGTFLLGDLLNASLVDMTQPPTPTTPLTLSDATVVSGIVSSQTSQRQLPPSLFAQSPFRADIRAFALLLLQVSQSIEHDDATITYDGENKQEEGNQAVKDNSAHARRRRRRRCTADNAGDALRLADDGSLTGCNDWIPWEDVERHWRTTDTTAAGNSSLAPPSSKMMAFIKQAFCGTTAHPRKGKDHFLAPRDEASTLLGHPFLTQYGRSNEQWKQLLKAALSDCAATSSSTHQSGGGVRFGMHRRTATGSTIIGSRHGSMPTTPVVSSPHHTSAASDAAVYAALFPYSPTTSRVPSSPTLDEMNVLTSSMRGSNNSLCGLFPPSVPPPVQRCNSHRIPLPFVRQPQGRR